MYSNFLFSVSSFLTIFLFSTEAKGRVFTRVLDPEDSKLFFEISRYYYTEESTRYLASILLPINPYEFVNDKLSKQRIVSWTDVAWNVILKWHLRQKFNDESRRSTTLLSAMEKSNPDAAKLFRSTLVSGKILFLC